MNTYEDVVLLSEYEEADYSYFAQARIDELKSLIKAKEAGIERALADDKEGIATFLESEIVELKKELRAEQASKWAEKGWSIAECISETGDWIGCALGKKYQPEGAPITTPEKAEVRILGMRPVLFGVVILGVILIGFGGARMLRSK